MITLPDHSIGQAQRQRRAGSVRSRGPGRAKTPASPAHPPIVNIIRYKLWVSQFRRAAGPLVLSSTVRNLINTHAAAS